MELDTLDLDSWNWIPGSPETVSEKSEKQKESAKKAYSQLQKTQKDEKKAKGDNEQLFLLLTRFIQNPLYEELIPGVTTLLELAFPSRFILSIVSLVYPDAADYVFRQTNNHDSLMKMLQLHVYESRIVFEEKSIHESIRGWISTWMSVSQRFLLQDDASVVLQKKLVDTLSTENRQVAKIIFWKFFIFFFERRNVSIEVSIAQAYASFIISEFEKDIKLRLSSSDVDLISTAQLDSNMLF